MRVLEKRKRHIKIGNLSLHIGFLILGAVVVSPLFWMVSLSFRSEEELMVKGIPALLPKHFTLQSYINAFKIVDFSRLYLNSFVAAVIVTVSTVFLCSLAGYSFAKYKFFGKNVLFILILSTMMIPFQVTMIPLYLLMTRFRWQNTYQGLTLPFLASAFGIFLMRQFIKNIPDEMIDAARIDGCSEFSIFLGIILPLSKSALATLFLLTCMWNWDSFLWPLIIINSRSMMTVPLGVAMVRQQAGQFTTYSLLFPVATVGMLPILLLFAALQRYFTKGIALTGLK